MYSLFSRIAGIVSAGFLLLLTALTTAQPPVKHEPYSWKNVQYVGGGFVDGIVFHPKVKDLCYCRTDMGGAYKRNPQTMRWEPLLDWISCSDLNLMGVESIALDPQNPDKLYIACGTYTNPATPDGAILRSSDRGKTFQRTNVPFKMGGNEDGRGNGERLAVDPVNGNILYFGTRHAGLWMSTDGSVTWQEVKSFPDITERAPANMHDPDSISRWMRMNRGSGIVFVIFDPLAKASKTGCRIIYVGVSLQNRENLYRSLDAGRTWEPVPGQPSANRPNHAVLAKNGMMYITYGSSPGPSRMTSGSVWKFNTRNGLWTEITPDKPNGNDRAFGYAAISVQADKPDVIIVSSFNRYQVGNGEDIFRSTDGGKTWKPVFAGGGKIDSRLAPYTAHTGIHWLFDIEIDPCNPEHAMFTTGYGGHETFNLTDMDSGKPTTWQMMSPGIEETVPLELLSPPEGAQVITAIGDYGGAVHWDPDKVPEDNFSNPRFGNTNGIACGELNPAVIVRVGRPTGDNPGKSIGYSLDAGRTWFPTPTLPDPSAMLGDIAVSSDGNTWIWSPDPVSEGFGQNRRSRQIPVFATNDRGISWFECQGIPAGIRVVADRVNPGKFYGMDLFKGNLYISTDGGHNFESFGLKLPGGLPAFRNNRGDSRGGQDRIYTTPGHENEVWIAAFDGLYWAVDGTSFLKVPDVEQMHGFGFGMNEPGKDYPALYMIGTVKGVRGIFRSTDNGTEWVRINDDQHQWGLILHITGDPKKFGRVYIGTHGRGTIYGDPVD